MGPLILFFIAVIVIVQLFIRSYDRQLLYIPADSKKSKQILESLNSLRFMRACLIGIVALWLVIWLSR